MANEAYIKALLESKAKGGVAPDAAPAAEAAPAPEPAELGPATCGVLDQLRRKQQGDKEPTR